MKKTLFVFMLAVLALVVMVSCANENVPADTSTDTVSSDTGTDIGDESTVNNTELKISSIEDYNIESEIDSHDGQTQYSHIELNYREKYMLDYSKLGVDSVYYPRVKQLADGSYIMFYMDGEVGPNIYYITSANMKSWSSPKKLFTHKSGVAMYACADAIVLNNGDVLVAASFRLKYSGDSKTNGLVIRRSSDNGKTWTEEERIYTGATWEPCLLQLPSGEIQIYWTNTHVKGAGVENGGRVDDNSTGTAMIRSFDNGKTWTSDPNVPYSGQIVAQQYTKTGSDGRYYSGQMPVATILNNGKIALALEVRTLNAQGNKTYNLSMAFTDVANSWPDHLGDDEEGPTTLMKNIYLKAAGPYIRQFRSGETVLTYHWDGWYSRIGNTSATAFNDNYRPFGEETKTDMWGSTEIVGTHKMLGAVPDSTTTAIYLGAFYLNHTIDAERASITVDGNSDDWADVDQAFYVGSESQAQTSVRTSQDDEYVYFIAETLDYYLSDGDRVCFIAGNTASATYHNIQVYANGEIKVTTKGTDLSLKSSDIEYKVLVNGTLDEFSDIDRGYVIELKVPKKALGDAATLIFNPTLYNKDKKSEKAASDTVGNISISDTSNWLRIKIG